MYQMGELAAGRWGLPFETPPNPDFQLEAGQQMQCGTLRFEVHHVPGHAPGHVMFVGEGVTLSGDLLFKGSIGRTDLPLCDPTAMEQSLALAAQLPPATKVYPGHGTTTTIAHELATNPFLNRTARVVGA
jgi:glyoxylase-like metal-dependent hydrolase (beta-lactamase superfamily II)